LVSSSIIFYTQPVSRPFSLPSLRRDEGLGVGREMIDGCVRVKRGEIRIQELYCRLAKIFILALLSSTI
jgi:hypothetical protein